ncbi:TonB-dependent receptor family protein [Parvularcula oceani]|uniref:TonB-dependent receptor family protein n=1 Tax=Parvularcula oceani TaxID=1247963 RepID=UPI00068EB903|nr:TonB-dependent receptor [Parvularcula oceani]
MIELAAAAASDAAIQDTFNGLDEIVVVGTARAGAAPATILTSDDLDLFDSADVLRTLRAVPGLQLGEEEGFGLRPNIGIRGSGSERSAKIALMEDGVPIAPAPYAAPAAYYFPTTARIAAVEVAKGPAAIQYGPQTTGGALHLFSTPLPEGPQAYLAASFGSYGRMIDHGWAGTRVSLGEDLEGAVMIEAVRDSSDGFKDLPSGADTGFEIEDYVFKGALYTGEAHLMVKMQTSDQVSDETYLGLTEADYAADPYRRYAASAIDRFHGEHETYQISGEVPLTDNVRVTGLAYRTEFARSWYKLQEIETEDFLGAGGLSGTGDCDGISEILATPELCGSELAVLRGADSPADAVQIRDNNREYYAEGVQIALTSDLATGALRHDLVLSVRDHQDGVDRFQDQDGYAFEGGNLVLTTDNADGTQANRLTEAEALALFAQDRIEWDRFGLVLGARFESVETRQRRWDTPDRALAPDSIRENDYDVFLPAIRADFEASDTLTLFAGSYEGFGVPSAGAREGKAEKSVNSEIGLVYDDRGTLFQITGYFNDYENLLGRCTASSGSSECDFGDQFNAGEVDSYGVEAVASRSFAADGTVFPVTLSYSWTVAEFQNGFSSDFDPWGDVEAGDRLPYVPEHQATLVAGIERGPFSAYTSINYVDDARSTAGQGPIPCDQLIEERVLVDLAARYAINETLSLRAFADNLFDETYTASLRPAGRRPGKPRELRVGIEAQF